MKDGYSHLEQSKDTIDVAAQVWLGKKGMRMFHFSDISSFRCEMKCKPPVLLCLRCRIQGISIHFEIWPLGRWRGLSQVYPQTWWHHGSEHYSVRADEYQIDSTCTGAFHSKVWHH